MSAGAYDITCEQGATFSRTLTVKDSSGNARNLSGYTARMQVRRLVSSSSALIELTTANGRISLNSSGEITLSISATDPASLAEGGTVERVVEGNFYLDLEVTR